MDWLTKYVDIEAIGLIVAIIAVIVAYLQLRQSKKDKPKAQTSVTSSQNNISTDNSSGTTIVTDSPGATVVGRDLYITKIGDAEKARPSASIDPITQQAHTDQAEEELSRILMLRMFDQRRARQDIQKLRQRVGDEGDFLAASISTKNRILYWATRLCASDTETRDSARQLRDELRQTDPEQDLSIVDALLAEDDGNTDEALCLLRDHRDPDSRTALFGVLTQSRGEHTSLAWYAE